MRLVKKSNVLFTLDFGFPQMIKNRNNTGFHVCMKGLIKNHSAMSDFS